MIKNDEQHANPRQRIAIIVVAILMLFSTFALYASVIIGGGKSGSTTTNSADQARFNELYQKYQDAVEAQSKELSAKYFNDFVNYRTEVKAYNGADITTTTAVDLKIGTGAEVTDENFVDYSAYYIGWLSDEKIFDSSFDNTSEPTVLKSPLAGSTEMIQGWKEGIVGMKIGGVRVVSIPSALGYGDQTQGDIPANSPLKFVIMLIDPVGDPEFDGSDELLELTNKLYGSN